VTRLLSEVRFASLLSYSPKGKGETSVQSRQVRDRVKDADLATLRRAAQRIRERFSASAIQEFFGPTVTLVPAPRSSPLVSKDASWPGRAICDALLASGLGGEVQPLLQRTKRVRKSAFATQPGERPSVEEHFATMAIEGGLVMPSSITIVDDVVTLGATLMAAASRIQNAFPTAAVRAFALVRTRSFVPDVTVILDPVFGTIRYQDGRLKRDP
jgi:hypothetical protein